MALTTGFEMRYKKLIICLIGLFAILVFIWKHYSSETLKHDDQCKDLYKEINDLYQQIVGYQLEKKNATGLPIIYAITPTYERPVQKAELTRISQTLALVPNVRWIVIEDADKKSDLVTKLLRESGLMYTHLNAKTPKHEKLPSSNFRWKYHRGVDQRNKALDFLRKTALLHQNKGVVYFMDDDNTYSIKLFQEIAKVKRVGVWPVGLVGGLNAEAPIVNSKTGKVTGWKSGWKPERPFAIDMAGFAINLDLILEKADAQFYHKMKNGMQESEFLSYFTTIEELEPLADNCTKVYVWHTRTENPSIKGTVPGLEV